MFPLVSSSYLKLQGLANYQHEVGSYGRERLSKVQQKEEDQLTTLICPKFYFSALYDSHVFSFEYNKGLECSKPPTERVYYLLI